MRMANLLRLCCIFLLVADSLAAGDHAAYNVDDYYALLKSPPPLAGQEMNYEEQLLEFVRQAWPAEDGNKYIVSPYVRTAEERRNFLQALRRLFNERLSVADRAPRGSGADRLATYKLAFTFRSRHPLTHRAFLLSLDGRFDEEDIWQLVALRVQTGLSQPWFAHLPDLFGGSSTHWTPEALAVFDLVNQQLPSVLGIQRLFARYQEEVFPRDGQDDSGGSLRLALPIQGLYPETVEHLLAFIEGRHLWRARGREDLAAEALVSARKLGASLSRQFDYEFSPMLEEALSAPVRYLPAAQQLKEEVYWPGGREGPESLNGKSEHTVPMTLRWVRSSGPEEAPWEPGDVAITRRVGSNDYRWWPTFQEAYLDLAYQGLPELLRRRLAEDGRLDVFRVWHAGSEDGSQTFLLAAILDEALALLAEDPGLGDLAEELSELTIEVIATDYAYMPDRRGNTYRFDASGGLGDILHKWNLIAQESSPPSPRSENVGPDPDRTGHHWIDPAVERSRILGELRGANAPHERGRILRSLADDGWTGELLGRFIGFAPEVDVPAGNWLLDHPGAAAKHRYRLVDKRWRIVELREDGSPEVVRPGTGRRLIRFEKGDMTQDLPHGFEDGDAFDMSVVTNVLAYIYVYYMQQGGRSLKAHSGEEVLEARLTPMEEAQDKLVKGSRAGAWIVMDRFTERDALTARRQDQPLDPNYGGWTDSWIRWVRSLTQKQIELHLTHENGVEHCPSPGYQGC